MSIVSFKHEMLVTTLDCTPTFLCLQAGKTDLSPSRGLVFGRMIQVAITGPVKHSVFSNIAIGETQRSTIMPFPIHSSDLALASVEDAHNQGAVVRVFGEAQTAQALYDADLQLSGVIIRPCHLVVVDRSRDPWAIVWRIATRVIIRAYDGETLTLDLGSQMLTIPFRDVRPESERSIPLAVGTEVLLQRKGVSDIYIAGELAHPERLKRYLDEVIVQHR